MLSSPSTPMLSWSRMPLVRRCSSKLKNFILFFLLCLAVLLDLNLFFCFFFLLLIIGGWCAVGEFHSLHGYVCFWLCGGFHCCVAIGSGHSRCCSYDSCDRRHSHHHLGQALWQEPGSSLSSWQHCGTGKKLCLMHLI